MASSPDDLRPIPEHHEPTLRFGCDDCSRRHSTHCGDCLVTHLCREDDGSVLVSLDELRMVRQLQAGGLAPPLRHRRHATG